VYRAEQRGVQPAFIVLPAMPKPLGDDMLKLFVATITLLTLSAVVTPGAKACDEDCAYEHQEAAYERHYERESAREEAAEEGYYNRGSSGNSGASRRRAAAQRAAPREAPAERTVAEPKPSNPAQSEPRTVRTKVAKENSSVATGSRDIAADDGSLDDAPRERKTSRSTSCKSYFPSVGMTLSVPCD
jgi:hypothetical protein